MGGERMSNSKSRRLEPATIEYKNMRFLITDRPSDATMEKFIEDLKKHNVKDVVRVCEPNYNIGRLQKENIRVLDFPFDDGSPPPAEVAEQWFNLLKIRFKEDPGCTIAVHCVAGLGRAPVMVALALIEGGMKYEDAVELIRLKRYGAINTKQLSYLEKYRSRSRLKMKNGNKGCTIQ